MEVIGVTFPIPKSYMSRFFLGGKTVFIKPAIIFKDLRDGMKFVFYQSQEDTGYVGEAVIKRISIADDPLFFFELYGNSIFLERSELVEYMEKTMKRRENHRMTKTKPRNRKWIAIELGSIHKYDQPKKPTRFVSIAGKYLKRNID